MLLVVAGMTIFTSCNKDWGYAFSLDDCITFTLKGKLKDGSTIRMKLVTPAEK